MTTAKHHSSVTVMVSDRGSAYLGIFLVFLMVVLSLTFFIYRIPKKAAAVHKEQKSQRIFLKNKRLKHSKLFLFPLHSKHFLLLHYPKCLASQKMAKRSLREKRS